MAADPRVHTPTHMGLTTALINKSYLMRGNFHRNIFLTSRSAFIEGISVLIPHEKGPTLRGQKIYDNL